MALDFSALTDQIADMLSPYAAKLAERAALLQQAAATLDDWAARPEEAADKIAERPKNFPMAVPLGALHEVVPPPAAPRSYTVIGVDGSQIDVDRHAALPCYLLNIGTVVLQYGERPYADLRQEAALSFREEELYVEDDANPGERERVQGAVLGAKRLLKELQALRQSIEAADQLPALGLADNALIPWGLLGKQLSDSVRRQQLEQYVEELRAIARVGEERALLLAGYVSRPNNAQVVNLLRWLRSEHGEPEPTDPLAQLLDRELFQRYLRVPGARSAVYESPLFRREFVKPVQAYFEANPIYFFYLWTGEEIARVEVPSWVARDPARLQCVHALVADQVRRGEGYVVALAEAHEQAVITGADRALFWDVVERIAAEQAIPLSPSAKLRAKRMRGV